MVTDFLGVRSAGAVPAVRCHPEVALKCMVLRSMPDRLWEIPRTHVGWTGTPTNAAAYAPTDLRRDLMKGPLDSGGDPDLIFASNIFWQGFLIWGGPFIRVKMPEFAFERPIRALQVPYLPGITVVHVPGLKGVSAVSITSSEVEVKVRKPVWRSADAPGSPITSVEWSAGFWLSIPTEQCHARIDGIMAFCRD